MTFRLILLLMMTLSANATVAEKKLPLCPKNPNCVSSQAADQAHFVAPLKIIGVPASAWQALIQAINSMPRMKIQQVSEDRLHAEATSLVFRFVDDLYVLLDSEAGVMQIYSASRIGYGDFGVNRKRVETLREQLRQAHLVE